MYGKKLKELRKIEGWTQEETAKKIGVSKQTYSHYENEKRKPGLPIIRKLAEVYQVNIDNIFSEEDTHGTPDLTTHIESKIISRYRHVSDIGKARIVDYIGMVYENEFPNKIDEEISTYEVVVPGCTAAGHGIINGDLSDEKISVHSIPKHTDYALAVVGDSMEPLITDGSLVFVKKQETLETGEIGVFETQNGTVCKKFFKDGNYIELRSINSKYKPIIPSTSEFRIIGKVLL